VRTKIVDAGRDLETVKELADGIAGERVARRIGEERRIGVEVADADVADVYVELFPGF